MNYPDFQHLARLYVVGALELEELLQFEAGRRQFGEDGEDYLRECRRMETAMALSLRPAPLRADARGRMLAALRGAKG